MVVRVNFGTFPFLFDIENKHVEVEKDFRINPPVVPRMIMDFFLCGG